MQIYISWVPDVLHVHVVRQINIGYVRGKKWVQTVSNLTLSRPNQQFLVLPQIKLKILISTVKFTVKKKSSIQGP